MTYSTTRIVCAFSFLISSVLAFAQSEADKKSAVKIDSSKPLVVEYKTKIWNHSGEAPDIGIILFRDSLTGKMARVEVTETDKNSDQFQGQYMISWGDGLITPEIYIPPQKMSADSNQMKQIEAMIKEGQLVRKPIFVRFTGKNIQTISVYDTKEQALAAYDTFIKTGNVAFNAQMAAAQAAKRAADLAREKQIQTALELAKEKERLKAEADEKRRKEELIRQAALLTEKEKQKRIQEAKKTADEAMVLYENQKYVEAELKFIKATELDPTNTAYNFQYGVTLYRNEKYNKSLALLDLSDGPNVKSNEKLFFKGLNHLKLQDLDSAKTEFIKVKDSNDEQLAATAAFYAGVIQFQKEEHDLAKANFEFVLDNSSDPKLDQQAESYIEQIANIMAFKENQKKKYILTASVGTTYDSNILTVSNSDASSGSATDLAGYRMQYSFGFEYRPVYTTNHEFSIQTTYGDVFSMDKSFKSNATFQAQDPLTLAVKLPYKYKSILFNKPFILGVNAGYETMNMNADGEGPRESILNSTYVSNENLVVMSDAWFATYNLELRNDKMLTESLTEEDDSNASRITFTTAHTKFIDTKKTTANIYDFGVTINNAKGDNQKYQKFDLGYSYMNPILKDSTLISKLGYYSSNYGSHTSSRKDSNVSLNLTLSRPLNAAWSLTFNGNYTANNSNIESSTYNKYSLAAMINWSEGYAWGSDDK